MSDIVCSSSLKEIQVEVDMYIQEKGKGDAFTHIARKLDATLDHSPTKRKAALLRIAAIAIWARSQVEEVSE